VASGYVSGEGTNKLGLAEEAGIKLTK